MNLTNKIVAFLGDSITEGVGAEPREVNRYPDVFARLTGADVQNLGASGTRIAPQHGCYTQVAEYDLNYYLTRVDKIDPRADVIVIFGGTNDFGHGDAPFGSLAEKKSDTFCGAFRLLLETVTARFPSAKPVVLTPLHRASEAVTTNEIGVPCHPLIDYVNAEIALAEEYGVPVLDLWRLSGIDPTIPENRAVFAPDGLHPSNAGARRIAEMLADFLAAL